MAAVSDCGFELVDHPPYSPDLASSDYFLFPNVKNPHLVGKQYQTDDEVTAIEDLFENQDESYTTGIQALPHRWKKCVDFKGDFVEKNTNIWSNSTIWPRSTPHPGDLLHVRTTPYNSTALHALRHSWWRTVNLSEMSSQSSF